ncbi:molybdate ABC transporter periplasmic molybdate-binding protein [bacterium BMS3Abin10]|nr:molybdate ABC transporter periplasmic molybdate-binding protein [bacterium BMS3Abin10]
MKTQPPVLPEIPSTRGDDLHNTENMNNADLTLFMAGNQFMVMEDLLKEFQKTYPEVKKIFYETLPPGLELRQILAGGARFKDMVIDVMPDIYTSVTEESMKELSAKGFISDYFIYLHNRIVLMIPEGNPCGIKTVTELGRSDIRISQPGALEDISYYIAAMYEKAGGGALVKRILEEKKEEGTTIFTVVHHRETPLGIREGTVDAGPVWATEVISAIKDGLKVEAIEPGKGLDQRGKVNYFITKFNKAPNPENADKFLQFIRSIPAQDIYAQYGFVRHFK